VFSIGEAFDGDYGFVAQYVGYQSLIIKKYFKFKRSMDSVLNYP